MRYRNPEQLRHTMASTLLSRNAPPIYIQQQGGWKSAAVLFRVYSRWIEQALPAPPEPPIFATELQPVSGTAVSGTLMSGRMQADASPAQARPEAIGASWR